MSSAWQGEPVRLIHFPPTRVAVLRHLGDPGGIEASIARFVAWRQHNRVVPPHSATFNIYYGDPKSTPAQAWRLDLCAAITDGVAANEFGVVEGSIPGGRCALLRHVGADDQLGAAMGFLVGTWLPASGQRRRDFPLFAERVSVYPQVAATAAITALYLPLQ